MEKIVSGKYKIVATGTVLVFPKNSLVVSVYSGTNRQFDIEFVFKFSNNKETSILFEDEDSAHSVKVILTNFESPIGGGSASPELIAEADKEKLYLHFRAAVSTDRELQEITYTVFSESLKVKKNDTKKSKRK